MVGSLEPLKKDFLVRGLIFLKPNLSAEGDGGGNPIAGSLEPLDDGFFRGLTFSNE